MNLSARSFTEPALFCTVARYVTDRESLNSCNATEQSIATRAQKYRDGVSTCGYLQRVRPSKGVMQAVIRKMHIQLR